MIVIENLNASTKYYVRVLASTKVGPGFYSESEGKFTNGSKLTSKSCCMNGDYPYRITLSYINFKAPSRAAIFLANCNAVLFLRCKIGN